MLNFGDDSVSLLPIPNSANFSASDRAHILGLYMGLTLAVRATTASTSVDPGVASWGG